MIITFFNKKGGTGKTSLAFNCAKSLNEQEIFSPVFLISNDDSVIEDIYPNMAKILEKIEIVKDTNVIYDLGGFIDKDIVELFKASNIIMIPTMLDINSIKRTINTVLEINTYCKNIVIVINRVKQANINKYKQSIEALKGLGKKIIYIRESEAITNSIHLSMSITELYNQNGLTRSSYKGIYEDYLKLENYIQEGFKNGTI